MATQWRKTPEDKIRDKFSDKINKIDANKDQTFADEEIKDFLENDKNSKRVSQLWELMKEHFETQTEVLDQFKEVIWRICERILNGVRPDETIDLNRWRILYFYLKHFHKEEDEVGRDIIRTVVDWSKWNRYQNVITDIQNNDEEWFDNLPWVDDIKAEWEKEQNLKKCNEILESSNRLSSEDIQWLNEYKSNWSLDSELLNKINERLDLEKCYQLLESTDLTQEDIQWLTIQIINWRFDPELRNKIDKKIRAENLKKCNELLESEYALSQEYIQWLEEYRDNWAGDSWQEVVRRIDERLQLEEASEDVARTIDAEMSSNPLSNLEVISPGFSKIVPNWKLIVQKITPEDVKKIETESDVNKLVEKIKATITAENISQYLPLPKWISEEDKYHITYNFYNILIKHLCLHPGYKIFWWKDPNAYATGMNLNNIVIENWLLESAFKKLEQRKNENGKKRFDQLKPKQKEEQLKRAFKENNHILFDLRLKNVLNSCDNKNIWEVIAYIINYSNQNYPSKLNDFAKNNTFISSVIQEYNAAKQKAEQEKKRVEEENRIIAEVNEKISQVKTVSIPQAIRNQFWGESSFKILSRNQINTFKAYYDRVKWQRWSHEAYDWFCKLYEYSKNFYNFDWFQKLWLPNCLDAQDYLNYLWTFNNLQKNINKINDDYQQAVRKAMSEYDVLDCNLGIQSQSTRNRVPNQIASACGKKAKQSNNELIVCAREFVKLRKKSTGPRRPDNFMWIKLDRGQSNKNPNNNSDVDDIIRDSLREWIVDKVKSFWRNATWGCFQQAFWDLIWLWTWLVFSGVAMTFTGNPALAGAGFYLGGKLGNWVAQVGWDLVVDWLCWKVIWLREESWSNRYDWMWDSFRVWVGQGKRDDEGSVVDAKSRWEWAIDTAFGTVATAATFQITSSFGITITENPFKYASIDEFINKPLSNMWAAAVKASIWTPSYEWVSVGDAVWNQAIEEYWVQWLTKKCINVFLVTAMVKWYKATYNWSKNHSDIIWKIDQKLDRVSSFLKSKGTSIEKLSDIPESEMKKLMKEGLSGLVDDLAVESQKWWNSIIVPMVPLAVSGLISPMLSPTGILTRRRKRVLDRIQAAKTQEEKDRYEKLLSRYDNIESYIRTNILSPTADNGNLSWDAWAWNESSQSQTQIDQQIENDFKIWDDGIIDIDPSDPSMPGPKTYTG